MQTEPPKSHVAADAEPAVEPLPSAWAFLTSGLVLFVGVAILAIAAYELTHSHFWTDVAPVFLRRALER